MMTIEELKAKYPTEKFTLYGECIVVPGTEFDPDFEVDLGEQGFECVNTDIDGEHVTLVQLGKHAGVGKKIVHRLVKRETQTTAHDEISASNIQEQAGLKRVLKGKDSPLGPRWTEDQYKLLIKLWNGHKKLREIATKFPDRSGHAVAAALARLKNSGAIEPRWTQKNRFSKSEIGSGESVINIRIDCGNVAALEIASKFLMELSKLKTAQKTPE